MRSGRRTTALLIVGAVLLAIGAGIFIVSVQAARLMNGPMDALAKIDGMKGVPLFPTALFDEMASRSQLATEGLLTQLMGAQSVASAGYSTVFPTVKVIAWYDREMPRNGFTPDASVDLSKAFREGQARQYRKGDELIFVHTQSRSQLERDTVILVFRFRGIK